MTPDLKQSIGWKALIGSGAVGTSLRERHGKSGPVEALNLSLPGAVRSLHEAYRSAGAQILVTNTFAANQLVLDEAGLGDECERINRTGVELAREASQGRCLVWASVGPLSLGLRAEDYDDQKLRDIYRCQCRGMTAADAVVLETFTALREARAAVDVLVDIGLPFILQIGSTPTHGARWRHIDDFIQLAVCSNALGIGVNCQHPAEILETAAYLVGRTALPVTAAPNAGQPFITRGVVHYDFAPDDFRASAESLLRLGVSVVGGCCGTKPEHIERIADLAGRPVPPRESIRLKATEPAAEIERAETPCTNPIRALMKNTALLVSVEIRAARTQTLSAIISAAAAISEAGTDMFDVPDNPGATVGRDAMTVAAALQKHLNVLAIPHQTVTQSNLLRLHSSIIGCGDMGLHGILAVTGDSPAMGDLPQMAGRVSDLRSSVELLRLIAKMRKGKTIHDQEIAGAPDLCAGCAVGNSSRPQMRWLAKKMEAGAEFAFSQPVFCYDDFAQLHEKVSALGIRLVTGILPLSSQRNAAFLAGGRIPGICVPPAMVDTLGRYRDAESQRRAGLDLAIELALRIAREAKGIYLIPPFGKNSYSAASELVRMVRRACG